MAAGWLTSREVEVAFMVKPKADLFSPNPPKRDVPVVDTRDDG